MTNDELDAQLAELQAQLNSVVKKSVSSNFNKKSQNHRKMIIGKKSCSDLSDTLLLLLRLIEWGFEFHHRMNLWPLSGEGGLL